MVSAFVGACVFVWQTVYAVPAPSVKQVRKPVQSSGAVLKKKTPAPKKVQVLDVSEKAAEKTGLDFGVSGAMDFGGEEGLDFAVGGTGTGSVEREVFEAALARMADEDYMGAALEWRNMLEKAEFRPYQQDIEYQLAKALAQWGLYDPALVWFKKILTQGPSHKRYKKAVEWLFFLSRTGVDEDTVLSELVRFKSVTFPDAYQQEYHYLMGKYLAMQAEVLEVARMQEAGRAQGKVSEESSLDFSSEGSEGTLEGGQESLDFGFEDTKSEHVFALPTSVGGLVKEAHARLEKIDPSSAFALKGAYVRGVLYVLEGRFEEAVSCFQEVVRGSKKHADVAGLELREKALMALARIHYGAQQFDRSVYYYDRIEKDSPYWLPSLFESSWAYFRRGEPRKALGQLVTLHAPFFGQEYFPESHIVRAVIYYEACQYAQARAILEHFIAVYSKVLEELERVSKGQESTQDVYEQLLKASTGRLSQNEALSKVLRLVLSDPQIVSQRAVVRSLEGQLSRVALSGNVVRHHLLGGEVEQLLHGKIAEQMRLLNARTHVKIDVAKAELKNLLSQALRVKLEVVRGEREWAEGSASGNGMGWVSASEDTDVDDDHVYWPYQGEYWRDELGHYQVDFGHCVSLEPEVP